MRFALPTGELRSGAAAFLDANRIGSEDYASGSRSFRPAANEPDGISYRVFRERDIPVQVALGNYDAGICSSASVDELLARYPNEGIVKMADLGFGRTFLSVVGARQDVSADCLTIVSEYPNLAEAFVLRQRVDRYRVLGVQGSAVNYPPEHADLALIASPERSTERGLASIAEIGTSSACLVASRSALATRDLSSLLTGLTAKPEPDSTSKTTPDASASRPSFQAAVHLALPDGHQQREAPEVCRQAGLRLHHYEENACTPRPVADGEDLGVKVIRPQDMPQMVAVGSFDLAITGRDCLLNHLAQFPSSPVEEVADLGRQRYRWAAVVHDGLAADGLQSALGTWRAQGREKIRIASEYPNLADHYARERHLGRYQVIPVVGASEGFVPEDAEILIEGSETGRTWAANNLAPLEWLFESTMIVIANKNRQNRSNHGHVERLAARFRQAA